MKLSFITPTNFIKDYQSQGDFVLALSHLIKTDKQTAYEKAILKTKLPIIIDNGAFENGVAEPFDTLIQKAIKVGATHFFAPDSLYESRDNQASLNKTIKEWEKIKGNKPKIAAVVQADNLDDYVLQLLAFNENKDVDMVGLSILSIPRSFRKSIRKYDITKSRLYLLRKMKQMEHSGFVWKKKFHLLGLGDSYADVFYAAKHCPFVVSNDTSSPFWNGVQNKYLDGDKCEVFGGKTKVPVDFNLKEINKKQAKIIQQNINLVKSNLKKHDSKS